MPITVDLAIVGAGPGGYSAALRAAELGLHVALIERDPAVGGTCLQRGCIPTKALVTAARTVDDIQHGQQIGIDAQLHDINYSALRDFRERTVSTVTAGLEGLLATRGIDVYHGNASVLADGTVHVVPSENASQVLHRTSAKGEQESVGAQLDIAATNVVLALGSRPTPLPYEPFHGPIIDSTQALALPEIPQRAAIIGAGAVALEFASIWNALGCETTLFIRRDHVMSHADRRSALALHRELKRRGITVVRGTTITRIDTDDSANATIHFTTTDDGADAAERTHSVQTVLAAIGRTPNTDQDWLQTLPIELNDQGRVITDPLGRTSMPHVWALGDITDGLMLAHHAFAQGFAIAESIAGLNPQPVNNMTVPSVIFSNPEFASVGVTAQEARDDDRFTQVQETVLPALANPRMLMSGSGGSMTVVTGAYADQPDVICVLGMHIVAPEASDLIAEAQQIVAARIPLHEAASQFHPHPTFSELIGEALLKADGRPFNTR